MMERLEVPFEVTPVDLEEHPPKGVAPEHVPLILSQEKAAACAEQRQDGVVLGADTVAIFEGTLLGKPKNRSSARRRLLQLRGQSHRIVTGMTVRYAGSSQEASITCISQVRLRPFGEEELERYLDTGKPLDRAGGYGIQDEEFDPVESVGGCPANVLGLPICMIPELFEQLDVSLSTSSVSGCRPAETQGCCLDFPFNYKPMSHHN